MKHLYIIGNGFDLHHNMITDYRDFRDWLAVNHFSVLCTIDEIFGCCDSTWWQHFEANLATAITSEIVQEAVSENYPNFASDDFRDSDWSDAEYAVQNRLEDAYNDIRHAFHEWINQLKGGDPARKIKLHTTDAFFVTFNYSHTLEDLYGIPQEQILYIHGRACTKDKLVLGHGVDKDTISQYLNDGLPKDEEGDYVVQLAKNAAVRGVYAQRKPVEDVIAKHGDFFKSLADVEYLHFYGHSLGEVDRKYFSEILKVVDRDAIKIEFNDYNGENKAAIDSFMKSEGFKQNDYSIISLDDMLEIK